MFVRLRLPQKSWIFYNNVYILLLYKDFKISNFLREDKVLEKLTYYKLFTFYLYILFKSSKSLPSMIIYTTTKKSSSLRNFTIKFFIVSNTRYTHFYWFILTHVWIYTTTKKSSSLRSFIIFTPRKPSWALSFRPIEPNN